MIALRKLLITSSNGEVKFSIDLSVNPTRYNWNKYCTKANTATNCLLLGVNRTAVYNAIIDAVFDHLYVTGDPEPKEIAERRYIEFVSDDHHRFVIESELNEYGQCVSRRLTIDDVEYDIDSVFKNADWLSRESIKQSIPVYHYSDNDSIADRFIKFLANTNKVHSLTILKQSSFPRYTLVRYVEHFRSYATALNNICRLTNCDNIDGITAFTFTNNKVLVECTDRIIECGDNFDYDSPIIADIVMITLFNVIRTAGSTCEAMIAIPANLYDVCNRNIVDGIQKICGRSGTQVIAVTNDYSKCSNVYHRPDVIWFADNFTSVHSLADKCSSQIKQRDDLTKMLIGNNFS